MSENTTELFSPLKIRTVEFRNRIAISPMCMYSSEDGFAGNWHMVHIGSRAVGGAGLVMMEATAISPEGRITPDDLGIWKDEHINKLKEIVNFGKSQGAVMGIQLAHAGRKASTTSPWKGGEILSPENGGWQTLAPSAIPFREDGIFPVALDKKGIEKLISDFRSAAKRALEAGFHVLEIHAAHGYLLHQFLSPHSNKRTDDYGGNFENRIRFCLEVTKAVREVWPESLPLFIRLSATDWVENGWNEEDTVKLAGILKENGVDLIDCSSGGSVPNAEIPVKSGYQVKFSEKIKTEANILTGAVGLITEASQAEEILQKEQADLIFIGREFLRQPYFPQKAAEKLGSEHACPLQYQRAKPKK